MLCKIGFIIVIKVKRLTDRSKLINSRAETSSISHDTILQLPEVNPETITFTGLGLFQQLFSLTRLSNASPFAQDSQNEEVSV